MECQRLSVISFKFPTKFNLPLNFDTITFHFYFICSVVQRCIPNDILSLIELARKNNVNLSEIMNITDIPLLPNAVKNIEFFAEFETVSSTVHSTSHLYHFDVEVNDSRRCKFINHHFRSENWRVLGEALMNTVWNGNQCTTKLKISFEIFPVGDSTSALHSFYLNQVPD